MLIGDILDVWKQGKAVANPVLWKNIGATAGRIGALLTACVGIASALGYHVDASDQFVQAVAYGIAAALFAVTGELHITTSEKVGLSAKRIDQPDEAGANVSGADLLGHD